MTVGPIAPGTPRELGAGVFVVRHESLDLNVGLVLGDERCLVVDTRSSDREATELIATARRLTGLPFVVVNTHAHFDHAFGNATFAGIQPHLEIWAHVGARELLAGQPDRRRREAVEWLRGAQETDLADEVARVRVLPPTHVVGPEAGSATLLDLGGRHVRLLAPGPGHTDHDLVVEVPDAGVTFAGDLVEQGAPPAFEDAWVLDWPQTLSGLLGRLPATVVPGHGDVVDAEFVEHQRDDLAEVAEAARNLPADASEALMEHTASRLPVGGPAAFAALLRARKQAGEWIRSWQHPGDRDVLDRRAASGCGQERPEPTAPDPQ